MCAILLGVVLCLGYSQAADIARCSKGNKTTMTLTPYNDGVVGRYLAEWCINVDHMAPLPTDWELQLTYFRSNTYCKNPPKGEVYRQGTVHSSYDQTIKFDGNCSHVCLNKTLDLIFKSCYLLKASFLIKTLRRNITDEFFYIDNQYDLDYFNNNTAMVNVIHHDRENITIEWHTGVPFQSYDSVLWRKNNYSRKDYEPVDCTAFSELEVRCKSRLPPGNYHTQLDLNAPWKKGIFGNQEIFTYDFVVLPPAVPTVESESWWRWALVALVIVIILGVAMRWVYRYRDDHKRAKEMMEKIRNRNKESSVPEVVRPPWRKILMLYAREGPVAAKLTAALRDMLQEAPDIQVYDIFSPDVMAMAASGPNTWVRDMLQQSDVAVLLLQTPALAALYQKQLDVKEYSVRLQEPLLGRRVMYREPQYGDLLLQYATQVITEDVHERTKYHKYHIATLSELPTEAFRDHVPYMRYTLPANDILLAQNLCGHTPSQQSLDTLRTAAREFADHAGDKPDYILDELIHLP